jgi:glutamine synthetase
VDRHADVVRASIAVPGNDFRLGAAEAPPAIISVYLGAQVDAVVRAVIDGALDKEGGGGDAAAAAAQQQRPGKLEEAVPFDLPASFAPATLHGGDRNRTSTVAFTGNKFEFRAVGSTQNCAQPFIVMAATHAESLEELTATIDGYVAEGAPRRAAAARAIRECLAEHSRVIFNGNNYSAEWAAEAERRGLPNLVTVPDALDTMASAKNIALFRGVLNERELVARQHVAYEQYITTIEIEARTAVSMARTLIAPAAAATLVEARAAAADSTASAKHADRIATLLGDLHAAAERVEAEVDGGPQIPHDAEGDVLGKALSARAHHVGKQVLRGAMVELRDAADALEGLTDAERWPLPTYQTLLNARDC